MFDRRFSESRTRARVEGLEARVFLAAQQPLVAQTNLISDQAGVALVQDPNLLNPWGVAFDPAGGELWISENNAGVASLYNVSGISAPTPLTPTVIVPGGGSTPTSAQPSNPTGQVFAGGTGFPITENGVTMNSFFVFVGEDGAITGWNPSLDLNHAVIAVDNSAGGAVYKGATLAQTSSGTDLFVANFNSGHIEVYDSSFANVTPSSGFSDRTIPKGYAPFNVQDVGGQLYVTYAKQDALKQNDVPGAGHGFVDVFDTSGKLIHRLQRGAFLNAPWGVTVAPSTWGRLAGDVLVGQFGSGRID
ncbi:MAG TPA: TIGR03118 family protein, partial [Tepidisphaeraceae bacterium]